MSRIREDLTLPFIIEADDSGPRRTPIVAFVPIALALAGIALILFGGLTARDKNTIIGDAIAAGKIDPIVTGSIAPRDHAYDLMMLDR